MTTDYSDLTNQIKRNFSRTHLVQSVVLYVESVCVNDINDDKCSKTHYFIELLISHVKMSNL